MHLEPRQVTGTTFIFLMEIPKKQTNKIANNRHQAVRIVTPLNDGQEKRASTLILTVLLGESLHATVSGGRTSVKSRGLSQS